MRLRVGKRPQRDTVNDAEYRSRRADSECNCGYNCKRITRSLQRHTQAVAEVLNHMLNRADASGIATLFFALLDATHRAECGVPGFPRREAFRNEVLRLA